VPARGIGISRRIRHIADENRFQWHQCAEECFFSILAEGEPRDVGTSTKIVIVGVLGKLDAITEQWAILSFYVSPTLGHTWNV